MEKLPDNFAHIDRAVVIGRKIVIIRPAVPNHLESFYAKLPSDKTWRY